MPWIMSIRRRSLLEVDLRPGVHGDEWDELLDAIFEECAICNRVRLLIPEGSDTGESGRLLDALVHVLTGRGIDVERRHLS